MTEVSTPAGARAGGGGRRLAAAFESVSRLPALAEARRRLLGLCEREAATAGELTEAVEADAGLAIAVMRAANNGSGPSRRTGGVREAIESLDIDRVRTLAAGLDTYDLLDHPGSRADGHERFRRHAVAVRNAAERIGSSRGCPSPMSSRSRRCCTTSAGSCWSSSTARSCSATVAMSPDERVRRERRELGIDHALVGAVLIRRWGVGGSVAAAVERHHAADAAGHAAAIRLGDLIVHQAAGEPVGADALRGAAEALGIDGRSLSSLLFEFPYAGGRRRRASEPCPLSLREMDALRGLAEGRSTSRSRRSCRFR